MALADTAQLAVKLTLDDRQFSGPLSRVQRNLKGLNTGFGRTGRGVGQVATGLARASAIIAGAVATGIGAAAKVAIDFEDAFAGIKKTVNETELTAAGSSFAILREQILNMSSEIPIAATEFARLGEIAGSLGVNADYIDEFIRTTALLGVTTTVSSDEAAEALGKIGTILKFTGTDYQKFADILVNLGNNAGSSEGEILEITKRFAGVARQAGLSTKEILALSSAAASFGNEPEAAGSALSRIFSNMGTEIANATDKGQAFSKLTGDSMKELLKRVNQGDSLGVLMDTLKGLKNLKTLGGKYKFLEALGITNVRDRKVIIDMANNLGEVKRQLDVAKDSAGALGREATKRFDTVASKIDLVKNNAIRAGIAMGTEMLPAIGRAADKISAVLKDPDTLKDAADLGKNVGKFIDDIDWQKVFDGARKLGDVLKSAFGWAKLIAQAFMTLPDELKGLLVGGAVLNKLSGGLIAAGAGNIVGGVGETVARGLGSQLPGVGKLFAQPVFVTNWPIGGLGGTGGGVAGAAKGGIGAVGKMFLVGEAIGLAVLIKEVADNVTTAAREQAVTIGQTLNQSLTHPQTPQDLLTKLAGVEAGIKQINSLGNIPAAIFHDTLVELEGQRALIQAAISDNGGMAYTAGQAKDAREDSLLPTLNEIAKNTRDAPDKTTRRQAGAFARLKARIDAHKVVTQSGNQKTSAGLMANKGAVNMAKTAIKAGAANDANRIIAAVRAARPIISVIVNAATNYTTVVKTGQTMTKSSSDPKSKYAPQPY